MLNKQYSKCFVISVVLMTLLILMSGSPQAEQTTLRLNRIDTTLYPTNFLNVTVIGPDGKPIENLKPENFVVMEEGKEQKVLDVAQSNEKDPSIHVVLVIDCSSSMIPNMDDTKNAAKLFLQNLSPDDKAALISFSTDVTLDSNFTNDRKPLETAIDNLKPRNATALYWATKDSIDLFKDVKSGNKAVLVLTDGMNNGPGSADECIKKSVNAGVPIFTIGLGNSLDASLDTMARDTGGIYRHAPTSADLADVYKSLAAQLKKQLWVKYVAKPQKWPKTPVQASIRLQNVPGWSSGTENSLMYIVPVQWWKIILSFVLVEIILILLTYFLFWFFWKKMSMSPVASTNFSVALLVVLTLIWYTVMFIPFMFPVMMHYFVLIGIGLALVLYGSVKMLAK
jgi:VWFA-related protein